MKAIILSMLVLLVSTIISFGQDVKRELPVSIITAPEFSVSFQNEGHGYLSDYLLSHLDYPENSLQWNQEGTEVVQFLVSSKGEVTDLTIINSVSPDIDREVERVLMSTSGMWRPAFENGKPVAKVREVSILFTPGELNPTDKFFREAQDFLVLGNKQFFNRKNNKNALYFYDRAVRYVPNDKCLLVTRGMCKYQLGDKAGACRDWNRIRTLGGMEGDAYLENFCEYTGYSEMIGLVQNGR
ncbi:MAG: energy transducer TonB [Prolixibacteraceae bacterium]